MTLKEIARPALLVAPDGWVAVTTSAEDLAAWNPGAMKRYAAMGVEVFSADHRIWKFEGFDVVASPTFLEKLRMWSMGLPALSTVDIHLREEPGDALGRLRAAFRKRSTGGLSLPGALVAYTPGHAFSRIRAVRRSGQHP